MSFCQVIGVGNKTALVQKSISFLPLSPNLSAEDCVHTVQNLLTIYAISSCMKMKVGYVDENDHASLNLHVDVLESDDLFFKDPYARMQFYAFSVVQ